MKELLRYKTFEVINSEFKSKVEKECRLLEEIFNEFGIELENNTEYSGYDDEPITVLSFKNMPIKLKIIRYIGHNNNEFVYTLYKYKNNNSGDSMLNPILTEYDRNKIIERIKKLNKDYKIEENKEEEIPLENIQSEKEINVLEGLLNEYGLEIKHIQSLSWNSNITIYFENTPIILFVSINNWAEEYAYCYTILPKRDSVEPLKRTYNRTDAIKFISKYTNKSSVSESLRDDRNDAELRKVAEEESRNMEIVANEFGIEVKSTYHSIDKYELGINMMFFGIDENHIAKLEAHKKPDFKKCVHGDVIFKDWEYSFYSRFNNELNCIIETNNINDAMKAVQKYIKENSSK